MAEDYRDVADPDAARRWTGWRPVVEAPERTGALGVRALVLSKTVAEKYRTRAAPDPTPGGPAATAAAPDEETAADDASEPRFLPGADEAAARGLPPELAATPHRALDAAVRLELERLLGKRFRPVTIYSNTVVDRVLRQYDADALTRGRDILVRQDKLRPDSSDGRALLGHELSHSIQPEPATPAARDRQEAAALRDERALRAQPMRPTLQPPAPDRPAAPFAAPPPAAPAPNVIPFSATPPPAQAAAPGPAPPPAPEGYQAASSRRDLRAPAPPPAVAAPTLSDRQLKALKDEMYRDLLDRIRTDFERGG